MDLSEKLLLRVMSVKLDDKHKVVSPPCRNQCQGNRGDARTKPAQQKEGVGSHGHTERRAQALRRSAGEVSSE